MKKILLGFVTIGVGFLVAYGVSLDAGKKRSLSLQIIGLVIALISIII